MITLLPVAAFAADTTGDRHASILKVDKTKIEADNKKEAKFTVYVRDNGNQAVKGAIVYVASERGTTDTIEAKNSDYKEVNSGLANVKAFEADNAGKVEFTVKSQVAGDAKVAVGLNNQVYQYLIDSDVTAENARVIGSKTITFEATSVDAIKVAGIESRGDKTFTAKLKEGKTNEWYVVLDKNEEPLNANGTDYYEVKFQVINKSGAPVEGEKVEFSTNKTNAQLNRTEVKTDEIGEAKVKVYATKHGSYDLEARKGSTTTKITLDFQPTAIDDFEVVNGVDAKVAYDENEPENFKLQLKDSNGNDYDLKDETEAKKLVEEDKIVLEWKEKPADSDLEDEDLESNITEDNGLFKVTLPELDEEGKYVVRVALEKGKYHDFPFEAKEQGDIVKLTLEYDEASLALGGETAKPTVKRIDKDGVKVNANVGDLQYTVNDYKLLASGYDINANNGALKATDDDEYTGELVVTVIDTKEDLTASYTLTIGDAAIGFNLTTEEDVITVGKEGKVTVTLKDRKGNQVALGSGVGDVTFDYYVIAKPENAMVSAEEASRFAKDLKEKGQASFDVISNKAGNVTLTVVLDIKDKDGKNDKKFSNNITLKFGEKAPVVEVGAKNVTLFIGATGYVVDGAAKVTDVAPFIQDNRTFVPVRVIAEALGCTNEDTMWDEATQTITLERADKTITLTIGSNIITVSSGETIVSDVAPFIKDGRTVLPFRAIGEAFGADVEAGFNADGTVNAVTFAQK